MRVFLAYGLFFFLYVVIPIAFFYGAYRLFKYMKHGKQLALESIPIENVTEKNLPPSAIKLLEDINQKGLTLKALAQNTESKNDDLDSESNMVIEKILAKDVPMAIQHYQRMVSLKGEEANVTIRNSDLTAEQSLQEILEKINNEFDQMLLYAYQNRGQKLLEMSRYLDSRFDSNNM